MSQRLASTMPVSPAATATSRPPASAARNSGGLICPPTREDADAGRNQESHDGEVDDPVGKHGAHASGETSVRVFGVDVGAVGVAHAEPRDGVGEPTHQDHARGIEERRRRASAVPLSVCRGVSASARPGRET